MTTEREDRTRLSARPVWERAWRWLKAGVVFGLVVAALVHPLASLFGRHNWWCDLISHLQEPAPVVSLVACAALVRRHPRLAILMGCLAVFQLGPLIRYHGSNPVPPDPNSRDRLRLLMANVMYPNQHREPLARLIRRERPDIVGLVEYTRSWSSGLAGVRQDFPFRLEAPSEPVGRGLALWFRNPPQRLDLPQSRQPGFWPFLHATFEFAGRTRHLWLVHPISPVHRKGVYQGNLELCALADEVWATRGSRIVIGDLNCTDGSPYFGDFLRDTGLRDSRLGFGRQGSWPVWLPFYRLAIDHAFVPDDLAVVDRRLGPDIGSDHSPVILDLAPAASAGAAAAMKLRTQSFQRP
jgi:endonuclease/exonuclease/phosphatase (EEP) superfamily protein YafD